MKKILATLLAILTVLSLTACGGKKQDAAAKKGSYTKGQYKIRIATVTSNKHAWVQMANFIKKELEEKSKGAISVSVFPGGQLGKDEKTIDDMRVGSLDMVIGGTQNAAPFVSQMQVLALPYLFNSRDAFEKSLDKKGQVFAYIQKKYDEKKLGLHLLALCNGGQRDLHAKKEIKKVADLKGLKMRVTSSPTESVMWAALGAIPTSMAFNDIYSAMQTNTVDAFECTLASYNSNALYEVAPYHIKTTHQFTPTHITCSNVTYKKLPKEFQDLLEKVCEQAALEGSKIADKADDTLLGSLVKEHGVKVCDVDKKEFKALVEPKYNEIAKQCKGEDLLKIIKGANK